MVIINKITEIITSLMVVVTICTVFAGVFVRYILHSSLTYSFELSTLLYAHIIFLGLSLALKEGSLIGVDIITNLLNSTWKNVLEIFSLMVMLVIAVLLSYYGFQLLLKTNARLSALQLSIRYLYLSLPVGFALFALNLIGNLAIAIRAVKTSAKDDHK